MEYGPKVRHSCESRNPEGPILGEIRLLKHAPRGCPPSRPFPLEGGRLDPALVKTPPLSSRMRGPIPLPHAPHVTLSTTAPRNLVAHAQRPSIPLLCAFPTAHHTTLPPVGASLVDARLPDSCMSFRVPRGISLPTLYTPSLIPLPHHPRRGTPRRHLPPPVSSRHPGGPIPLAHDPRVTL